MSKAATLRHANFTHYEKTFLCLCVGNWKEIIDCKKTDSATCERKRKAWLEVTNCYNANTLVSKRDEVQLKRLWEKLKYQHRKRINEKTQETETRDTEKIIMVPDDDKMQTGPQDTPSLDSHADSGIQGDIELQETMEEEKSSIEISLVESVRQTPTPMTIETIETDVPVASVSKAPSYEMLTWNMAEEEMQCRVKKVNEERDLQRELFNLKMQCERELHERELEIKALKKRKLLLEIQTLKTKLCCTCNCETMIQ